MIPQSGTLAASRTERDKLMHNYRIAKDRQFDALCADPKCGDQLRKFVRTLGHFGIEHAERWIAYVNDECRKWLRQAHVDMRFAALQACDERIQKIRIRANLPVFDDPLPGEPDDVFRISKMAMGL